MNPTTIQWTEKIWTENQNRRISKGVKLLIEGGSIPKTDLPEFNIEAFQQFFSEYAKIGSLAPYFDDSYYIDPIFVARSSRQCLVYQWHKRHLAGERRKLRFECEQLMSQAQIKMALFKGADLLHCQMKQIQEISPELDHWILQNNIDHLKSISIEVARRGAEIISRMLPKKSGRKSIDDSALYEDIARIMQSEGITSSAATRKAVDKLIDNEHAEQYCDPESIERRLRRKRSSDRSA